MKYDGVSVKSGSGKKKGAAESKELSEDGPAIDQADKGSAKKGHHKKGGAKHHGNMPKKKGAAEYGGKKGDDSKSKKDYEGAAKYKKGAGDYDVKKGSHDHPHGGSGRMGYTQNFGPARQNSYAKGAAKVAKIMGYPGAGDHIDGHPAETAKQEELKGVTIPGHDKSSEGKMDINEFNQQSQQLSENINAARTSFDKTITSDSLNQVLNVGSGNINKLDLKRYEKGRKMLRNIPNYSGNSLQALEQYGKHNTAFQNRTGMYSDENLKKK